MAELVDALDQEAGDAGWSCGFDPHHSYKHFDSNSPNVTTDS